jgi:Tfp pilus assembly protein PilV
MQRPSTKYREGIALVEVIIAASIILIFVSSLVTAFNLYLRMATSHANKISAALLSEEGIEAVKILRDISWDENIFALTPDADYYLYFDGTTWLPTTTAVYIDGVYERTFKLSEVYRDSSSDIVSFGGSVDPDTRLVLVSVSWSERNATTTKSISTYITNLFKN